MKLDRNNYALYVGNRDFTEFSDWDKCGSSFILTAHTDGKEEIQ